MRIRQNCNPGWDFVRRPELSVTSRDSKDNARPEAGEVYEAMDMGWAKLVGQVAQAYGK